MPLCYDIVDVFTDRPFAGNPLAVVHGADGLTTEQCQRIAQEFGFSETTFPAAHVRDGREYTTRIFTPEQEIPFAGHPTLGTAWVLRSHGLLTEAACVQQCGAGTIDVRFDGDRVELAAAPRDLVGPLDAALVRDLLRLVGLRLPDLSGEAWVAGCGLSFVHLPVTEEAVVRAVPAAAFPASLVERLAGLGKVDDLLDAVNVYAVTGDAPRLSVHSRVFVPGAGVSEDPATGSAAAGLGMALAVAGLLPEGGRYDIVQGIEMGRPSALHCRVEAESAARPRAATWPARCGRSPPARSPSRTRGPDRSAEPGPPQHPPVKDPGQRAPGGGRRLLRGGQVGVVRERPRCLHELPGRHDPPHGAGAAPSPRRPSARSGRLSRAGHQRGRGRLPPLVVGPYDGRGADPGHQPAAVVLAAQHDLDAGRRPPTSGSGCSVPPETTQSASSDQTCHTACERPAWRTQRDRRLAGQLGDQGGPQRPVGGGGRRSRSTRHGPSLPQGPTARTGPGRPQ